VSIVEHVGVVDSRNYMVNNSLAKRVFGWEPEVCLQEGIMQIADAITDKTIWPSTDLRTHTLEWYKKLLQEGRLK
jgi:hypothetical protein